ncbi:unnamed protein product [Nippostrongylus brasiliensis]|uniref:Uncharacterized protein n=1 Tax=Nippostrongylus brasiliensis TaxID=27835 RepID=A0A0N4YXM2_NIPBR|nr:unnamed protein product [Nippostrongylus brasiliensis]
MAGLLQYSTSRGDSEDAGFHTGSHEAIDNLAYQLYSQFRLNEDNRNRKKAKESAHVLRICIEAPLLHSRAQEFYR